MVSIDFKSEDDLEKIVKRHHFEIFGENSIYFAKKKLLKVNKNLHGVIPDGFVLFLGEKFSDSQLFAVEVELEKHSFSTHIQPQIWRISRTMNDASNHMKLTDTLYFEILSDDDIYDRIKKRYPNINLYKELSDLVTRQKNIIIVIDGLKEELIDFLKNTNDVQGVVFEISLSKGLNDNLVHAVCLKKDVQKGEKDARYAFKVGELDEKEVLDNKYLIKRFDKNIIDCSKKYWGLKISEIVDIMGSNININSKNYAAEVIYRALGVRSGDVHEKEYTLSKLNLKTVRCNPGLKPIYAMSLRGYRYTDIVHETWETKK